MATGQVRDWVVGEDGAGVPRPTKPAPRLAESLPPPLPLNLPPLSPAGRHPPRPIHPPAGPARRVGRRGRRPGHLGGRPQRAGARFWAGLAPGGGGGGATTPSAAALGAALDTHLQAGRCVRERKKKKETGEEEEEEGTSHSLPTSHSPPQAPP